MASSERPLSKSISSHSIQTTGTNKRKKKNNYVSSGFKEHMFRTTLEFVKDNGRLSLQYPNLLKHQADFICSMIQECNDIDAKFENTQYPSLLEVFKIFTLKFEFILSAEEHEDRVTLILQKIPRTKKLKLANTYSELNENTPIETKPIDRLSHSFMLTMCQRILKFINDKTRVSLTFKSMKPLEAMFLQCAVTASKPLFPEHTKILECARKIMPCLDFHLKVEVGKVDKKTNLKTVTFYKMPKFDSEEKLKNGTQNETSNGVCTTKITNSSSVIDLTSSSESLQSLADRNKLKAKHESRSSIKKSRIASKTTKSSLSSRLDRARQETPKNPNAVQSEIPETFHKIPETFHKLPEKNTRSKSTVVTSVRDTANGEEPNKLSTANLGSQKVTPVVSKSNANSTTLKKLDAVQPKSVGEKLGPNRTVSALGRRTISVDRSAKLINFTKSTCSDVDISAMDVDVDIGAKIRLGNSRKDKLVVAMSTPVIMDKPARMMAMMGWDGGPLGCRGEGITEPIIPHLHQVSRGGLGHTKEKKESNALSRIEFRLQVLENILELINSDCEEKVVTFKNKLCKKWITFVRNAVTSVNQRSNIVLNSSDEKGMVAEVMRAVKSMPGLMISGAVSGDKKQVLLKKDIRLCNLKQRTFENVQNIESSTENDEIITEELLNDFAESIEVPENLLHLKSKKAFAKKIIIIDEILNLTRSSNTKSELQFDNSLTVKEIKYLETVVENINMRVKNGFGSSVEHKIYKDIMKSIGNHNYIAYDLDNGYRKIIFQKSQRWTSVTDQTANAKPNANKKMDIDVTDKHIKTEDNSKYNNDKYENTLYVKNNTNNNCGYNNEDPIKEIINHNSVANNTNYSKNDIILITDQNNDNSSDVDVIQTLEVEIPNELCSKVDENSNCLSKDKKFGEIYSTSALAISDIGNKNSSGYIFNDSIVNNKAFNTNNNDNTKVNDNITEVNNYRNNDLDNNIAVKQETNDYFDDKTNGYVNSETSDIDEMDILGRSIDDLSMIDDFDLNDTILKNESQPDVKIKVEKIEISNNVDSVDKTLSYSEFDKDLDDLRRMVSDVDDYVVKKEADINMDYERPLSSKRCRNDSVSSHDNSKKPKLLKFTNFKTVNIVPKNFPKEIVTSESFLKIQSIISDAIDNTKELPLLKCHGVINGALSYSCHNEKSLFFIEKCLSVTSEFKILDNVPVENKFYKMSVKLNSLCCNVKKLFNRLELYNVGLNTVKWCATDVQSCDNYIIILIEVDAESYKYVCKNNYLLYAGVDVARFSAVWH